MSGAASDNNFENKKRYRKFLFMKRWYGDGVNIDTDASDDEKKLLDNGSECSDVMRFHGITDIGNRRKENQDCFAIDEIGKYKLLVVCDGMGGANGGDIASKIGVEVYIREIKKKLQDDCSVSDAMVWAVQAANKEVIQEASQSVTLEGMGTTIVAATVYDNIAEVANVGDSRLYKMIEGKLEQVTSDHSYVEELVMKHQLTREEAAVHPLKNVITRVLGSESGEKVDTFSVDEFESLLLCTDGLSNMVSDNEIEKILLTDINTTQKCEKLFATAIANGGYDNITVVLAEK